MSLCDSEWCSERISALEAQLAEERAKREAVSDAFQVERTILIENQFALAAQVDKAERELAEMRRILLDERAQATKEAWAASEMQKRAETAERELADGKLRKREDYFPEVANLRARNREMHDRAQAAEVALAKANARAAELQALVDAADGFEFEGVSCANCEGGWSVSQFRNGCWNTEAMQLSKADAIALAREIAKKEPS